MRKSCLVKQRDLTDCGAACIASIATYYKLYLPIARIRQYAGTDTHGTNILGLTEALTAVGFQAKAAKGKMDSLAKIPLPAILHLQLPNGWLHYVVLYKINKNYVKFMDPADGKIHKQSLTDFDKVWTKVLVLALPDINFTAENKKTSHFKRFWILFKPQKSLLIAAFIGAIITTILGLSTSIYVQKIIDFVIPQENIPLLNLLSCGMLLIVVLQLFLGIFKSILVLIAGQYLDVRLIMGYYRHILQLPLQFFDTMRVGEIVSRLNDAVKIRFFINEVAMQILVDILVLGFSISLMFFYSWKLALVMMTILPIYIFLNVILHYIQKKWQRKLMEEGAELEAQLVESLQTIGTIKRFYLEEFTNTKTENRFIILLRSIFISTKKQLYLLSAGSFFTQVYTIIILWAGSYWVIKHYLTPGQLLSFYALIGYLTGPASNLLNANKSIQESLIAADRLFEIIDLEIEKTNVASQTIPIKDITKISFEKVHFRYGTRNAVLNNFSLALDLPCYIAIVGESGCGKSTIAALLQNLYPIKDGKINFNETNVNLIKKTDVQNLVVSVPQKTDLFLGNIIQNIALGEYEPDFQLIQEICRRLDLERFIESLPQSYATIINEQGLNLSGGQRQRLAIARALYKQPKVLILDEATSQLDVISEQKVLDTLQWYNSIGNSIIMITHRLSTVKQVAEILVMDNGQVISKGDHSYLMQHCEKYQSFWN